MALGPKDIGTHADICSIVVGFGVQGQVAGPKGVGLAWFVRQGSVLRGPYSSGRVRQLVLDGSLASDDEVSSDKIHWRRLGGVPEVVPRQLRMDDAHWAAEQTAQGGDEQAGALRATLIVSLVLVALTVGVSLIRPSEPMLTPDCAASPAPGVLFEGCRLSGADMTGASLARARMANAVLDAARMTEAHLLNADLRYANLAGADLSYARLDGAELKGANLRSADLTNADLSGADLSFADLSGARLGGARFDRTLLEGAIWPDGRPCKPADCPR
jgi:hypothetical protein